ncbi:MAG: endonuclease III [bacterium]|nr:endonuclease III [bacterium]
MTKIRPNSTTTIPDFERRRAKFEPVLDILREVYGPLEWMPGQNAMDELVSCILSQNTNDANRDRAFYALKGHYESWEDIVNAPIEELIDVLRPAGLANQKAPRIQKVLEFIRDQFGTYDIDFLKDMPLDEAKQWLTNLDGVGPKTAAIVLCFSFNLPAFPVDTHIHRVGMRIGFLPEKITADKAHPVMEAIVPPEGHYAFHIYLIRHGRDTCTARRPYCERCPLTAHCDYYQQVVSKKNNDSEAPPHEAS